MNLCTWNALQIIADRIQELEFLERLEECAKETRRILWIVVHYCVVVMDIIRKLHARRNTAIVASSGVVVLNAIHVNMFTIDTLVSNYK